MGANACPPVLHVFVELVDVLAHPDDGFSHCDKLLLRTLRGQVLDSACFAQVLLSSAHAPRHNVAHIAATEKRAAESAAAEEIDPAQ